MNKRIEKLAELCTSSFVNMHGEWEDDFDKEKFAELIVKECFKAAMTESSGHMNPHALMKRMKEQVGVEE